MDIDYTVQVWKEGEQYISHAMPLDVASCGSTETAARKAVDEAVQAFIEASRDHGTLDVVLEECGYESDSSGWNCPSLIGIEKHTLLIPS